MVKRKNTKKQKRGGIRFDMVEAEICRLESIVKNPPSPEKKQWALDLLNILKSDNKGVTNVKKSKNLDQKKTNIKKTTRK